MANTIKTVTPLHDLVIEVIFLDGTVKNYDLSLLLSSFPQFAVLKSNPSLFRQVRVDAGGYGISWNDEIDLDSEDIWENGTEIRFDEPDFAASLGTKIAKIRTQLNITQKQLSELTGIYQSDISKIERGLSNPSISTLLRIASGLDRKLKIEFF